MIIPTHSQDPRIQYKIRNELSSILERVNDFHLNTQNEFQFLHKQYMEVSRKLTAIINNLKKLQTVFNSEDLTLLLTNLDSVRKDLLNGSLNSREVKGNVVKDEKILVKITELQAIIRRIKKEFRNDLISQSLLKKNEIEMLELSNYGIRNLVTTDLIAMVSILENALNILTELFGIKNKKNGAGDEVSRQYITKYIDFLLKRIADFHLNVELNVNYISEKFELCRKTGDEIITALQYQDIFGQKMVHVIRIIENIRNEFEKSIQAKGKTNRYSFVIPEVISILISHLNNIESEFTGATEVIIDRLNHISNKFLESRENFEVLNHLIEENSVLVPEKKNNNGKNGHPSIPGVNGQLKIQNPHAPVNKDGGLHDSANILGNKIDALIREIRSIKIKVKEVIVHAMEPAFEFPEPAVKDQVTSYLTMNSRIMDILDRNPLVNKGHSDLIQLSNDLFDEVIISLQAAKERYSHINRMSDFAGNIINRFHSIARIPGDSDGQISQVEKSLILEDFRNTYSMKSERVSHDKVLGIHPEEDLFGEEAEPILETGEVELF